MKVLNPLRACLISSYFVVCDPFFAGTLTCVKTLETCVDSDFAPEHI
jgi:hypothetical protein